MTKHGTNERFQAFDLQTELKLPPIEVQAELVFGMSRHGAFQRLPMSA